MQACIFGLMMLFFGIAIGFVCSDGSEQMKTLPLCLTDSEDKTQKIYQMGRDGEQTKRHLSAKMQLTIALAIEQGFVAPLCHSHFDGKGGCKVFVLRNELNQRLISVNSTDEQKKNGVLDAVGPEVSGTNETDSCLFPFAFFCADPRRPLFGQMPSYSFRVNWMNKTDPDYLEMHANGTVSTRSVLDLTSKGPHQFFRIQNTDGTISLRSKTHNLLVETDSLCSKFNLTMNGHMKKFKFFSACSFHNGTCDYRRWPFYCNKSSEHDVEENNPFSEFESYWFTGLHFLWVNYDSKADEVKVEVRLKNVSNKPSIDYDQAVISGAVHEESNHILSFHSLLHWTNLYKDNEGRYTTKLGRSSECTREPALITDEGPHQKPTSNVTSLESCFLNFGPFQLSDQKPLREIFPQLFSEEPDDKRNYLVSKNSFDDVNAVPITYHELESAMGMELHQTINPDVKIVLVIALGQNLA